MKILSNEHAPLTDGKYFYFKREDIPGLTDNHGSKSTLHIRGSNTRNGADGEVVVWGYVTNGSGEAVKSVGGATAHGRFNNNPKPAPGQWRKGDYFFHFLFFCSRNPTSC